MAEEKKKKKWNRGSDPAVKEKWLISHMEPVWGMILNWGLRWTGGCNSSSNSNDAIPSPGPLEIDKEGGEQLWEFIKVETYPAHLHPGPCWYEEWSWWWRRFIRLSSVRSFPAHTKYTYNFQYLGVRTVTSFPIPAAPLNGSSTHILFIFPVPPPPPPLITNNVYTSYKYIKNDLFPLLALHIS